jgi:hypothetical protein
MATNESKETAMTEILERPAIVTDEHVEYLDELRESGVTNMYGAGPYLVEAFGVSRQESHAILGYWMRTFAARHGLR